jgi:beta-phosphoglucomutase
MSVTSSTASPPHDLSDGTAGAWLPARALFVVEDASSRVQAGEIGVARLNDQALLKEAGADLVVTSLDDVALRALSEARLDRATIR